MKDLVLVATVYIDDGWYGDNHRIILSESEGVGFTRKGDARKFAARLKKYAKRVYEHKKCIDPNWAKNMDITCDERESFISYTYVSLGPSISYAHHDITVNDLLSFLSE